MYKFYNFFYNRCIYFILDCTNLYKTPEICFTKVPSCAVDIQLDLEHLREALDYSRNMRPW